MSEFTPQGKKQSAPIKADTVHQRQSAAVLQDNRASPVQAKAAPTPNRTGMPDTLKSGIESLSGMSMDHVKVHYNSDKPAQLQAHAYAQGSDIHLAPGQEKHLPHEAWHVVQQAQGRVRPTVQMKGGADVNDDAGLEREADVMGHQALQHEVHFKGTPALLPGAQTYRAQRPLPSSIQLKSVIQKQIKIGSVEKATADLLAVQLTEVKSYIRFWLDKDHVLTKPTNSAKNKLRDDYFKQSYPQDVVELLAHYEDRHKEFSSPAELTRQLVQDIKLRLLGLPKVVGVDHREGQFFNKEPMNVLSGLTGKDKSLRIYRTMLASVWDEVRKDDVKALMAGHGGSLGQALHYFLKAKNNKGNDRKDVVLIEIAFDGKASDLVDFDRIASGGEGGGPHDKKMTGKKEANDIMVGTDVKLFSINLEKHKDHIADLQPKITVLDRVTHVA
ncbi:DUF4157 domain-containing protein [Pseudomonas syringae]|nr:DUF4157 domain-containing protein [Pseudomonas syringae]